MTTGLMTRELLVLQGDQVCVCDAHNESLRFNISGIYGSGGVSGYLIQYKPYEYLEIKEILLVPASTVRDESLDLTTE